MGAGFRPWCRRNKTGIKEAIESAVESHWVTHDEIQEREIHDTDDTKASTCEACCFAWVKAAAKND